MKGGCVTKELFEFIAPLVLFGAFIVVYDKILDKKEGEVKKKMALINCPECGKEVSDKAKVCINCGYPIYEYVLEQKEVKEIKINSGEIKKEIPIRDNICPNCGNEISPVFRVCSKCGYNEQDNSAVVIDSNNNYESKTKEPKVKCKYCNSTNIDHMGYCNECGMQNHVSDESFYEEEIIQDDIPNYAIKTKKKRKKRRFIMKLFYLFILFIIAKGISTEEKADETVNKEEKIYEVQTEKQTELHTEEKSKIEVVETGENETEKNYEENLNSVFSNHIGQERADLLCDILFTQLGFEEVRYIKKVENTFNYEVWIEDQKSMITDLGDDFRIFIPNTEIVFYENSSVLMTAEDLEARTIRQDDISKYYIIAKTIVEGGLKNPSSAKFPSLFTNSSSIAISKVGDLICMQSYVDATNSFGAKVRTDWTVQFMVIDLDSFSYETTYIKIGDDAAGEFIPMD